MKSTPRPADDLGNAAAARVRLIVWCKDCGHRLERVLFEAFLNTGQRGGDIAPMIRQQYSRAKSPSHKRKRKSGCGSRLRAIYAPHLIRGLRDTATSCFSPPRPAGRSKSTICVT
jgi:hypothetical protein